MLGRFIFHVSASCSMKLGPGADFTKPRAILRKAVFPLDFFFRGYAVTFRDIPEGDSTLRSHLDFFWARTNCLLGPSGW